MDRYEKALEQARNYYPDNLFLDTIFPELAESEDDRIMKFLKDYTIEMIAGLESDISISVYDGVKGHDPEAEAELEKWKGVRAWLEKQKEQKPAEWSEEEIVNWLKENFYVSSFDNTKIVTKFSSMDDMIKSVRKRLKSLRPQPHWKPSEEQMESLKRAADGYDMTCRGQVALDSLYNDLKKLM